MNEPSHRITESHRARGMAESFGTDPGRYDRTRPRYPQAVVDRLIEGAPGADVLDVGTGTGIAARQFRAAGCRVLGIEVDTRMADYAHENGIEVEVARFEEWDAAGRTFDLVTAGQAWHWIDPVRGAARAAAVLRPGGRLAVFWNALEPPPQLADAFAEAYRQAMPEGVTAPARSMSAADGYAVMVAKAADGIRQAGGFGPIEEWRVEWEHAYGRDAWLDQLPTSGGLTQAPPDRLQRLLDDVGAAIDAVGGSFTAHYTTLVGTATRR